MRLAAYAGGGFAFVLFVRRAGLVDRCACCAFPYLVYGLFHGFPE
jgi:hypothetical protein